MLNGTPKNVRTALIQLQTEFAVSHINWNSEWQGGNAFYRLRQHSMHSQSVADRGVLYHIHHIAYLVNSATVVVGHERH